MEFITVSWVWGNVRQGIIYFQIQILWEIDALESGIPINSSSFIHSYSFMIREIIRLETKSRRIPSRKLMVKYDRT